MGPEVMGQHLNPGEYIKRLAAAQGIDTLELVKSEEQLAEEQQQAQQQAIQQSLVDQAGQLASTPVMDPDKNPAIAAQLEQVNEQNQAIQTDEGGQEAPTEGQ
jgi:hypothetical protein|tara:strand:+ start:196 stop:504 length:309 start_codon:yes stop_codon:yes gene_type:complete